MQESTIGRPMEVLMVEDSLVFARITMAALKNGGVKHRLTWLTDGIAAMDFLQRTGLYTRAPQPDLILLDLGLPKKDGREVLEDIRADDDLKEIPIVVMTASEDEADRELSERLQVECFVTKPVDLEKFVQVVKDLKHCWHEDMVLPG